MSEHTQPQRSLSALNAAVDAYGEELRHRVGLKSQLEQSDVKLANLGDQVRKAEWSHQQMIADLVAPLNGPSEGGKPCS